MILSLKEGQFMDALFESLNSVFSFITPVSDWLWDFPTNYDYSNIDISLFQSLFLKMI